MGLFSKKEVVPEIPMAPVLPDIPEEEIQEFPVGVETEESQEFPMEQEIESIQEEQPQEEDSMNNLPELPSFPSDSMNEDINQEIVKSAVTDMPSPGEEEEQVEMAEEPIEERKIPLRPSREIGLPPLPPRRKPMTLEQPMSMPAVRQRPAMKPDEAIFVRIDKFKLAQKNFEEIKNKVKEMESVIKRIKDVKSQEETELKGWIEDIEKIKSRLAEVDSGVFNQI